MSNYWETSGRLQDWTDEEWRAAFRAEGPFGWSEWYGGFSAFKQALAEQGAEFNSYCLSSGRCIDCDARVAVYDLQVEFLHRRREDGEMTCDRRLDLLKGYRDPCGCD